MNEPRAITDTCGLTYSEGGGFVFDDKYQWWTKADGGCLGPEWWTKLAGARTEPIKHRKKALRRRGRGRTRE